MISFVKDSNPNIETLLTHASLFLVDADFKSANEFCDKVLAIDPQNAVAYLGKLLAEFNYTNSKSLANNPIPLDSNVNYQKIMSSGNQNVIDFVYTYNTSVKNRIYGHAKQILKTNPSDALKMFELIPDWKDSAQHIAALEPYKAHTQSPEMPPREVYPPEAYTPQAQNGMQINNAENVYEEPKKKSAKKIIIPIIIIIVVALGAFFVMKAAKNEDKKTANQTVSTESNSKEAKYSKAVNLYNEGEYAQSLGLFMETYDYKDSKEYIDKYNRETLSAHLKYTVAVKNQGTVIDTGSYYEREGMKPWKDVVAVSAGNRHTVALKKDGTVYAAGNNDFGQLNVSGWYGITSIVAGDLHTVGLKSDGTVVATVFTDEKYNEGQCDVENWKDIVAVSAGISYTTGLKKDGTVIATGNNTYGQCNVRDWTDIVAISGKYFHTVGLKSDGTVVAAGNNSGERNKDKLNVGGWTDIVAVATGGFHTVGLKSDGTVVAVGDNTYNQCDVNDWTDIIAISAGDDHTVGLKSDGTVVFTGLVGDTVQVEYDINSWKNIKVLK